MASADLDQMLSATYLELAHVCNATYNSAINHRYLGYNGVKFVNQKIVHGRFGRGFCRVFANEKYIVIALRGTREKIDWKLANLRCRPVPMQGYESHLCSVPFVHQGFQSCLELDDKTTSKKSIEAIIYHIDKLIAEGKDNIVVTGHSLGGALAILLTLKIALYRPDLAVRINEVVTFGAPAIGFGRIKWEISRLNIKITRIVNGVDLVSFAPPVFYRHVGSEIWLRRDRSERQPTWLRRIIIGGFSVKQALLDHDINSYIKRLKNSASSAI